MGAVAGCRRGPHDGECCDQCGEKQAVTATLECRVCGRQLGIGGPCLDIITVHHTEFVRTMGDKNNVPAGGTCLQPGLLLSSLLCVPAGAELSAAIASWQQRHQLAAVLSTGFLDGSHPIVDAYELGVRLQHMLRRLTALAAGALVQVGLTALGGACVAAAAALRDGSSCSSVPSGHGVPQCGFSSLAQTLCRA